METKICFRPLLEFFISNRSVHTELQEYKNVFVPYWGSLFLIELETIIKTTFSVFVPYWGSLFLIEEVPAPGYKLDPCFRPLLGFFISNHIRSKGEGWSFAFSSPTGVLYF